MIRRTLAVLVALLLPMSVALADEFKVKDCDSTAAGAIRSAHAFVQRNLTAIFDRMSFLDAKQRDEMKRKWPRLTADCIDNKPACAKKDGLGGRAHGGPGNQVNICYYNHVDLKLSMCDLVDTLVHEEGHANGMPILKGHNDPTPSIKANDLVYRMGDSARAFCEAEARAGRFTDAALKGRSSLGIGAACGVDDQCRSGKCEKGNCVCKVDADCGGGMKCRKPLGGLNRCER